MQEDPQLRVVYVSYDGALDPLGASQVVPYIRGLSGRGVVFTLISFEKSRRWSDVTRRRVLADDLAAHGVTWRPRPYHSRPRLAAKLWDMTAGALAVRATVRSTRASLVHCRGDVALAIVRLARLPRTVRLIYDVRGLFADERVESGSWRAGSLLDRVVRRIERQNYRRADGIVVLTSTAQDYLRERYGELPPHRVIPTCVDPSVFVPRDPRLPAEYGPVYAGSLGERHRPREVVRFMEHASSSLGRKALFLTPDTAAVSAAGVSSRWAEVCEVAPGEVPRMLCRAQVAVMFYAPGNHLKGVMPTKLGEALACGLPIVASAGIGDVDALVEREEVGVIVRGFTQQDYVSATDRVRDLLDNRVMASRCRRVAQTQFDVSTGVAKYHSLYATLGASAPERRGT
jgi:glycosyltransferase involved in cell wall biosynthesis